MRKDVSFAFLYGDDVELPIQYVLRDQHKTGRILQDHLSPLRSRIKLKLQTAEEVDETVTTHVAYIPALSREIHDLYEIMSAVIEVFDELKHYSEHYQCEGSDFFSCAVLELLVTISKVKKKRLKCPTGAPVVLKSRCKDFANVETPEDCFKYSCIALCTVKKGGHPDGSSTRHT